MLIGLTGYINSGKGTVASYLNTKYSFKQDSFAASLKDACSVMFNWPRNLLEGDTIESRQWREQPDIWWSTRLNIPNFTPRLALQLVGTNSLRDHFHQDIWFLSLANRVTQQPQTNFVISDVRFANEIKFIKENNGIIINIRRGKVPDWYHIAVLANAGDTESYNTMTTVYSSVHPSEWSWAGADFDYYLDNNQDLASLYTGIDNIVSELILL